MVLLRTLLSAAALCILTTPFSSAPAAADDASSLQSVLSELGVLDVVIGDEVLNVELSCGGSFTTTIDFPSSRLQIDSSWTVRGTEAQCDQWRSAPDTAKAACQAGAPDEKSVKRFADWMCRSRLYGELGWFKVTCKKPTPTTQCIKNGCTPYPGMGVNCPKKDLKGSVEITSSVGYRNYNGSCTLTCKAFYTSEAFKADVTLGCSECEQTTTSTTSTATIFQ